MEDETASRTFNVQPVRKADRYRRGLSYCGQPDCLGPRKCRACRTAYVRAWRRAGRERHGGSNVRTATVISVLARIRRGLIVPQPCETCGDADTYPHHDDYRKRFVIRWFCRRHPATPAPVVRAAQQDT